MYQVVYPLGRLTQQPSVSASGLESLDGMRIAQLSNHKFGSEITFKLLEKALKKRYPLVEFVSHETFGDMYGPQESEVIKALPRKLKDLGCDAVISGNGG